MGATVDGSPAGPLPMAMPDLAAAPAPPLMEAAGGCVVSSVRPSAGLAGLLPLLLGLALRRRRRSRSTH